MNQNEVGNILKDLRVKKGFTQKDIAESLIITPQTVSKWELGVSYPSIDMLIALADLYDVSVDELIRGDIEHKDVVAIKDGNKTQFQIVLYILYVILLGLGISLLFVDYINVDIRALDEGNFFEYWFNPIGTDIITVPMKISNVFMQVLFIVLPLSLIVINLIDSKKVFTTLLTIASFSYLYVMMLAYMNAFFTISANVGMLLHGIYVFVLLLSVVLFIRLTSLPLEEYIKNHKKQVVLASTLFVLGLLLPLCLTERTLHLYVIFSLLPVIIYPVVYPMISDKEFKVWILVYGWIVAPLLIVSMFEAYHKGSIAFLIIGSLYVITLVYGLISEMREMKLSLKTGAILTVIELISLWCYGYLMTSTGDLWFKSFNNVSSSDFDTTIRINNMVFGLGYTAHISFALIIILMCVRFLQLHNIHKNGYFVYAIIQLGVISITFSIYTLYMNYRMTDGLFFYIPPILLFGYYVINKRLFKRND